MSDIIQIMSDIVFHEKPWSFSISFGISSKQNLCKNNDSLYNFHNPNPSDNILYKVIFIHLGEVNTLFCIF